MKNLTLVLVLSMAAFAGCKKKDDGGAAAGSGSADMGGGSAGPVAKIECDAAFDHALSLEKEEMKKMMPTITEEQIGKIRGIALQHCKDDKWGDEALKCFMESKTAPEADKCDQKLSPDQKSKFNDDMMKAVQAMMPAMGSGSAMAGSGSAMAAGGGDLPKECQDYKAAMEKLAACDKMPQASKDALKQGYDAMATGWANMAGMPPAAQKAMTDGCKQGADALMQSGKALCGW